MSEKPVFYRTRAVIDEATCPTCRAADGSPGPMAHVCEHLAEGGVCRCILVRAEGWADGEAKVPFLAPVEDFACDMCKARKKQADAEGLFSVLCDACKERIDYSNNNTWLAPMPEMFPTFVSLNTFTVKTATRGELIMKGTLLDRDTNDFEHLIDKIVRVDGQLVRCVGVERFAIGHHRKGEKIALAVEPLRS